MNRADKNKIDVKIVWKQLVEIKVHEFTNW